MTWGGFRILHKHQTLRIQSPSQMMIGVYNHLLRKVFRFHYHSQKVIGSLGLEPHDPCFDWRVQVQGPTKIEDISFRFREGHTLHTQIKSLWLNISGRFFGDQVDFFFATSCLLLKRPQMCRNQMWLLNPQDRQQKRSILDQRWSRCFLFRGCGWMVT